MSYPKKSAIDHIKFITQSLLPFSCPPRNLDPTFQHPRVYLTFEHNQAVCPFCGTTYQITEDKKV
ncbi:zinc-finger domain-containing protein [bacterium]|jgi:uncharacterized Zn-finger protein|nr:zinc-finger domain-containing protein [bacterium]NBX72480.1 zinc-finger domain-containing protein [bacterium]